MATPSLQQFIAEVKKRDWAFQSKYQITLPPTVGTTKITTLDYGSMSVPSLQLYCEGAELPGVQYATKPFHFYGPDFQRPTDVSYGGESLQLSFMVDQEFNIRRYFDSWIKIINDRVSYVFSYPTDYMSSSIIIKQLKHRGPELIEGTDVGVYSVRLINAFPKIMAPMTLNFGSREFHRLAITMAFSRWIPAYGDDTPPANLNEPI